jgi:predicted transcriptional regulator
MANIRSSSLDSNKNKIALFLQMLGVSRIESLSIVSLLDGNPHTSRELEDLAGLHQPEVSVAMRPLCE